MTSALRVSVVLPSLNEEQNLARALDALSAQDLPNDEYEVVLVDGGSEDSSVELAESMGVRVVRSTRGVSVQRNRGAVETAAPVLAYLDSDCVAPPDWLRRGLRMIEDEGAALAGGPIRSPEGSNWTARAWDIHLDVRQKRLVADTKERFRLIATANLFIRRDVFERIGGFDESLASGEDFLLCAEVAGLGLPVAYDNEMTVSHLGVPSSPTAFFREQIWHSNREVWRRLSRRTGGTVGQSARRYGLLTIGLLALVAAGAVHSVVFQTIWSLLVALAMYAAAPLALAAHTSKRLGSARHLVPLFGMYALYGLARAVYQLGLINLEYHRHVPANQARPGF